MRTNFLLQTIQAHDPPQKLSFTAHSPPPSTQSSAHQVRSPHGLHRPQGHPHRDCRARRAAWWASRDHRRTPQHMGSHVRQERLLQEKRPIQGPGLLRAGSFGIVRAIRPGTSIRNPPCLALFLSDHVSRSDRAAALEREQILCIIYEMAVLYKKYIEKPDAHGCNAVHMFKLLCVIDGFNSPAGPQTLPHHTPAAV